MERRVSVIMAVHNRPRLTEAAIRSVLAQDESRFELIVVDDGSEAPTRELLACLASEDGRVRVLTSSHAGPSRARILAHEHATAPYVGWVDSDDLVLPSCLRETADHLDANPGCDLVYTDHLLIDEHGKQVARGARSTIPYSPEALLTSFMVFHFRLYRREIYDRVGGLDPSLTTAQDYDLCLKISEAGRIERLDRPLYLYRRHAGSVSVQRRVEQIENSALAVRNALVRRGLDKTHELRVQIAERFEIVPKR